MFTHIAAIPVSSQPPLKGAALEGFRAATANWEAVAAFEAEKLENGTELAFSQYINGALDRAGAERLSVSDLDDAQAGYDGPGRAGGEDAIFVLRGTMRLKTIFQQAQIVGQGLMEQYVQACHAKLTSEEDLYASSDMDVVNFVENAHLFRERPQDGVMDAFSQIEIETQCVMAMRHFKQERPQLEERRLREAFWSYVQDVATQMLIPSTGAFTYKPAYFEKEMTMPRGSIFLTSERKGGHFHIN